MFPSMFILLTRLERHSRLGGDLLGIRLGQEEYVHLQLQYQKD